MESQGRDSTYRYIYFTWIQLKRIVITELVKAINVFNFVLMLNPE